MEYERPRTDSKTYYFHFKPKIGKPHKKMRTEYNYSVRIFATWHNIVNTTSHKDAILTNVNNNNVCVCLILFFIISSKNSLFFVFFIVHIHRKLNPTKLQHKFYKKNKYDLKNFMLILAPCVYDLMFYLIPIFHDEK